MRATSTVALGWAVIMLKSAHEIYVAVAPAINRHPVDVGAPQMSFSRPADLAESVHLGRLRRPDVRPTARWRR
jgi:hypothetical protein